MHDVSKFRFYWLRGTFAFITLGQVLVFWPKIFSHDSDWALRYGNEVAILSGMTVLMAMGMRYPIKMLPVLMMEFTWKVLWLSAIYWPLARDGRVDDSTSESLVNVVLGVVVCGIAIPWGYVWGKYVKEPAERWGARTETSRQS